MTRNYKDRVYKSILEDILYLRLAPGERIDESELAKKYGVSRTPIREALLDLKSIDLVKIISRNGTYVSEIDFGDVLKTLIVKNRLEGLVAELATPNLTTNEIEMLERNIIDVSNTNSSTNIQAMLEFDMNFHNILHIKCYNDVLLDSINRLQHKCFRAWYFLEPSENEILQMVKSLELVVEAIKKRDPIDARVKMEEHSEVLFRMIQSLRPDYTKDVICK